MPRRQFRRCPMRRQAALPGHGWKAISVGAVPVDGGLWPVTSDGRTRERALSHCPVTKTGAEYRALHGYLSAACGRRRVSTRRPPPEQPVRNGQSVPLTGRDSIHFSDAHLQRDVFKVSDLAGQVLQILLY